MDNSRTDHKNHHRHSREGGNPAPSFPRRRESNTVIPAEAGIQEVLVPAKEPAVYILASKPKGTLYTGVTSNLSQRVWQHKNDLVEGFTKRYGVHTLVYCEFHSDMGSAIVREKQIKKWNREWKIRLIEKENPEWADLCEDLR